MNKDTCLRIRINNEEKKLIYEKAKSFNMKMSDYVRFVSLNTKEIKREEIAKND